tara:strand:+ start:94 stop:537 length:444 start_codon:yes stop_codon:yes gene_type:complete
MRKGQVDIFGLLLIIIMIVFIGVIIIALMLARPAEDNDVFLSSKASNMVNSLVKASSCGGTLEDAMVACCEGTGYCLIDACEFVEGEINKINLGSKEDINLLLTRFEDGADCGLARVSCEFGITSSGFLLQSEFGSYDVRVQLCTEE